MRPEDFQLSHPVVPGIYRNGKSGWRAVINIKVDVPALGKCQHHILSFWPAETTLDEMVAWRASEKPKLEQHWREHFAAQAAEHEQLQAEVARLKAAARKRPDDPDAGSTATIRRLQHALLMAERRAEAAEDAARRAYRGFAGAGARR